MPMPDDDIIIHEMCSGECGQAYAIERLCFPGSSWKLEDFEAAVSAPGQYYVVARTKDRVVGFGVLYIMAGCADLVNIAVHPDWRRRGIGDMLLQALLSEAKEHKLENITLEVRMSNETAIHLYEKHGFRKISIRRRYYRNPVEDACIMQRGLSGNA